MKLDKLTEATILALMDKLDEDKGSSTKSMSITKSQARDLYNWFLEGDNSVGVFKFNNKIDTYRINSTTGTPEPIYSGTAEYVIDIVDYMKEMTPYYIKNEREGIDIVYNYVNDEIKSNETLTEAIDEENSLDDIANYIKGIVDYNVTITPTGGGFSSYDVNFLNYDDSIMYSVAVNNDTIKDKVGLLNTLIIGLDRFYRGKTFADIIGGKLLDELNKIHPVNKKVAEARREPEINNKVAPRDRKQSFEGGPNKLSNKASGIAINDEDTAETGVNRISVGKHKGEIIGRDIKRDRVRSAEQALNRRNAGPLDFAGENDMLHFEVSPNERSAKYRKEHGMVTRENKELNETFTIDTFNNKYKPLYDNSVTVKDNVVSADNILLRGSGIPKRVSATLNNNDLRIDNENIDIVYDGNNIKTSGQYWFTSNMEDDEKFSAKVTKAVKSLYDDMKKLQGTTEVNSDKKTEEKENLKDENEVNPEADKLIKDYYDYKMDLPELHKALINLFGNKRDAFKYLANNDLRVKNKKLENIQSNHQGICPKCGSMITDYGQIFWDDEGIGQEFNCTNPKCKAHGIEYYNTTFDYIEVEDN